MDGRAGMAAITLKQGQDISTEDLKELFAHCNEYLPQYAIPRFLRVIEEMDLTGTFKQRKGEFVAQGFDPSKVMSKLYFADLVNKSFEELDRGVFEGLTSGKIII